MVTAKVTIKNPTGLHMRPAQIFVQGLAPFSCEITIAANGKSANAKSILSVMAACFKQGTELEITCDGADEAAALAQAEALLASGLGELV